MFWNIRKNIIDLEPCNLNRILLFGPYLELYQSFDWLSCWNSKLQYAHSGLHYQFVQGHWWELFIRNCTVWPTLFLLNIFTALKGTNFYILLIEKVPKFGNLQFKSSIYAKLAVETSVRGRVPPIKPTSCYPVTLGFQSEESVPNLGHRAKLNDLIIEIPKFVCPRLNPSTYAQLAGGIIVRYWVSPIKPTTCNPVALGLKQLFNWLIAVYFRTSNAHNF